MATHSGILAWKVTWTKEPGGQQTRHGVTESDTTGATYTEIFLNAGGGHQAPRKAAHSLQNEVGQNIKDQKRD